MIAKLFNSIAALLLFTLAAFLVWSVWRHHSKVADPVKVAQSDPQPEPERGASVAGYCSVAAHKAAEEATKQSRAVADMGLGETACVFFIVVDQENRAYLRKETALVPADRWDCQRIVRRTKEGYFVKCGKTPLPDPVPFVGAGLGFLIPVKAFF